MFASWPMVFGALTAGVIAGFLIPEDGPGAPNGSAAAVSDKSSAAPKMKAEAAPPVVVKTSEVKTSDKTSERDASAKKSADDAACEKQTWPYLTPSCLDRSARNEPPAVVVKTRLADPPTEGAAGVKPEAKPAKSPAVAATPAAPADDAVQAQKTSPAAAPEKSAPPAKRQAAQEPEASDEPVQPRAKARTARRPAAPRRNRAEQRYAGRADLYDERQVYIQRGGRLYLAPQYRQRLHSENGYWREW